jgi:putative ABC transport system permease protein
VLGYVDATRVKMPFFSFTLSIGIIACLGLAGLAAFSTAQRTKEIGIRKALGATSASVVVLLSRDFLKPVGVAALLAGVIGWIVADKWASNFAYRADLGIAMIAGCALVMVVIAAVTVSFQAFRAAGADPVSSIRYE